MRATIAFALCMFACTASLARVFTVDDLLAIESYGQAIVVPDRDLMLVEHRRGYDQAADFAYDTYFTSRMVTRILATSASRPGKLQPLFAQPAQAGYWIASLSPAGTRLAVYRLQNRRLSLGVVELATRSVRWFPWAPDLPAAAPAPVWIDEDRLVYIAMTRPRLPANLSGGTAGTRDLTDLWARQSVGGNSRTLVTTRSGAIPDDGERSVLLLSVTNGSERRLARGDVVDMALAPSGRRLAVVIAGSPVIPPSGPINAGFDSRRHQLVLVDTTTGRQVDPEADVLRGFLSWSPADRLLVVTRPGGSDWTRARWASIDVRGHVHRLGGDFDFAAVAEVGGGRLVSGGWAGTSPIALVRRSRSRTRWARLRTRKSVDLPLTAAARPVGATTSIKWMLDGRTLYAVERARIRVVATDVDQAGVTVADPYSLGFRLARDPATLPVIIDTVSGAPRARPIDGADLKPPINLPRGAHVLAVEADSAIVVSQDRHADTLLSLLRRGSRPVEIDRINAGLQEVELPRAIDLKTTDPSGKMHHDWLLVPATPRQPALIVNPYPGLTFTDAVPREAGISRFAVPDNALLLLSAGFAVLLPSMPIDTPDNPADTILSRIDAATDAAVATGLVDRERIGLQGHSFGAYAALTVATRSSRYKAIVAANGPYDLFAMHGNMPAADKLRLDYGIPAGASIGWTEGGQGGIGAPPGRAAAAYLAASPMVHLRRVTNPVLLIAGDLDPVDATQAERAFMELYRHGKDATLARYWGEGHSNASAENIRDYWRLITTFFDEHLRVEGSGKKVVATSSRRTATPRRPRAGRWPDNPGCGTDIPRSARAPGRLGRRCRP